jgi:hypothetical protein
VLSGLFVAVAVQMLVNQIMIWGKFGLSKALTPAAISSHTTAIGLWLTLSATVGIFVGSLVATTIAGSSSRENGVLHGASVWGLTVVVSVFLTALGVAGIMGFGITPHSIVSYYGLTGSAAGSLAGATHALSGWFLLELFVSAIFGLGGGSLILRRRAAAAIEPAVTEEEYREERRVA